MRVSRTKFVLIFLAIGFAFIFGTAAILNQPPEAMFGTEAQMAWQSVVSTLLSPLKIILIGPLLPVIEWLHQDPDTPPPFFLITFAVYWSFLAVILHHLLFRKTAARQAGG